MTSTPRGTRNANSLSDMPVFSFRFENENVDVPPWASAVISLMFSSRRLRTVRFCGDSVLVSGWVDDGVSFGSRYVFPMRRPVIGIAWDRPVSAFSAGHARFEVGDAQALKFKDAAFDNTLALLVMNFVPDPNKAIAEMRRVTRPQGIVSACVWDYDAGMQMLRFFWDAATALDPSAEKMDEKHMPLCRAGGDALPALTETGVHA